MSQRAAFKLSPPSCVKRTRSCRDKVVVDPLPVKHRRAAHHHHTNANGAAASASSSLVHAHVDCAALGTVTVVASCHGVTHVLWPGQEVPHGSTPLAEDDAARDTAAGAQHARAGVSALRAYFSGSDMNPSRRPGLCLDVAQSAGSPFAAACWLGLAHIAPGSTRSYADHAVAVGATRRHARAVGGAMKKNPLPLLLPCHRVVGSTGALTGFRGRECDLTSKQWLLQHERKHACSSLSTTSTTTSSVS